MNEETAGSLKIRTTGQLRDFLAGMMMGVKSGDLDLDKASRITKLAGQVNESFYAEIKVASIRAAAGEELAKLGAMPIGESD